MFDHPLFLCFQANVVSRSLPASRFCCMRICLMGDALICAVPSSGQLNGWPTDLLPVRNDATSVKRLRCSDFEQGDERERERKREREIRAHVETCEHVTFIFAIRGRLALQLYFGPSKRGMLFLPLLCSMVVGVILDVCLGSILGPLELWLRFAPGQP